MKNIGIIIKVSKAFQNRTGEKCEPFAVVVIAVKIFTLEIIFVVDKVVGYAIFEVSE